MTSEVVLVVEDEPLQCAAMEDALTDGGFTVIACSEARQALSELNAREDIAAVVTDIRMPGEFDGLIVAWRSALRRRPVPVLVVSAFVRSGSEPPGSSFRFLPKPVNLDHLVREVREAIDKAKQSPPPDTRPRRRRQRIQA